MNNSPLKTVVVPAVFVSSVTFSALTLPFALLKSEPLDIELPPFFKGEVQPMFDGEHNDRAISYVGFAIVASVAAGIASVEVTRKRLRDSPQPEAPLSSRELSFSSKEAQTGANRTPGFEPETATNLNGQYLDESTVEADDSLDFAALVQAFDTVQQVDHLPTSESVLPDIISSTSQPPDKASVQSQLTWLSEHNPQHSSLDSSQILESSERYQACRVQAPGLQQSSLAIIRKNQYYSLLKAEKTREGVLEVVAKLGQPADKIIVTKTEKSYTIWNLMSETNLVIHNP